MRHRHALPLILAAAIAACAGDRVTDPTIVLPPPPPPQHTGLHDVVVTSLPSPYYHFEYDDAGRVVAASLASGLRAYVVRYDGDRIRELDDTIAGHGAVQYDYDAGGRAITLRYLDGSGQVDTRIHLSYDGWTLLGVERERLIGTSYVVDKTTTLSYYADGNLMQLTEHRPAIAGHQDETTTTDRFEGYDGGVNVDDFDRLHSEFFDHLLLVPGVRLQKNNPARLVHTGDGINLEADYTYTYDSHNRPTAQVGDVTITNGADAGRRLQTRADYTYY